MDWVQRLSPRPLAALAAAAVAACAGTGGVLPTAQVSYDNSFAGSEIGYATQFGVIPVFTRGAAIENRAAIDALVTMLNRNHAAQGLQFAPAGTPNATAYSVVLVYGQSAFGTNICDRTAAATPVAPGTQLTGSFCLPGRIRSQAVTILPTVDFNAPATRSAADELLIALFSPDRGRGRGRAYD